MKRIISISLLLSVAISGTFEARITGGRIRTSNARRARRQPSNRSRRQAPRSSSISQRRRSEQVEPNLRRRLARRARGLRARRNNGQQQGSPQTQKSASRTRRARQRSSRTTRQSRRINRAHRSRNRRRHEEQEITSRPRQRVSEEQRPVVTSQPHTRRRFQQPRTNRTQRQQLTPSIQAQEDTQVQTEEPEEVVCGISHMPIPAVHLVYILIANGHIQTYDARWLALHFANERQTTPLGSLYTDPLTRSEIAPEIATGVMARYDRQDDVPFQRFAPYIARVTALIEADDQTENERYTSSSQAQEDTQVQAEDPEEVVCGISHMPIPAVHLVYIPIDNGHIQTYDARWLALHFANERQTTPLGSLYTDPLTRSEIASEIATGVMGRYDRNDDVPFQRFAPYIAHVTALIEADDQAENGDVRENPSNEQTNAVVNNPPIPRQDTRVPLLTRQLTPEEQYRWDAYHRLLVFALEMDNHDVVMGSLGLLTDIARGY